MIKLHKGKAGFTLIEIVLVIAIILILAAVLTISISGYINNANKVASNVNSQSVAFNTKNSQINDKFVSLGY